MIYRVTAYLKPEWAAEYLTKLTDGMIKANASWWRNRGCHEQRDRDRHSDLGGLINAYSGKVEHRFQMLNGDSG